MQKIPPRTLPLEGKLSPQVTDEVHPFRGSSTMQNNISPLVMQSMANTRDS